MEMRSGSFTEQFPAREIMNLHVICKNYKIRFTPTDGSDISIRFQNNRFRKLTVQKYDTCLRLEESVKVTFYGLFRFIELMQENTLEIEIPSGAENLNIFAETGAIGIDAFGIHAETFSFTSSTGTIHIQEVQIGKTLTAYSAAGKIFCQLSGKASDYDIDCRADRKDIQQPIYPSNAASEKKIILHSGMYVPKLSFMD